MINNFILFYQGHSLGPGSAVGEKAKNGAIIPLGSLRSPIFFLFPPMWSLVTGYHGQLTRTILESSSKRRVVCLKQETTFVRFVAGWIRTFHFLSALPTPIPYRRLSYVVFVVGTIGDCIRGVQSVVSLFQAFRSWRTRHTPLSERVER